MRDGCSGKFAGYSKKGRHDGRREVMM